VTGSFDAMHRDVTQLKAELCGELGLTLRQGSRMEARDEVKARRQSDFRAGIVFIPEVQMPR